MNKNVVIILVLITIFNVYNTYGNENSIQPHNVDMRVKNFSGNMLNEKGIILKWYEVQKSKGYVIYRNSRKIATIKSKGKKGKKKVFNSKIVWSSSDESLATVDQNGVVKANNNRKTGTVYITARAINGVKKVIKVDVINYYNPLKFKNYRVVPEELAPLFGKYKNELCEIATYFAFDNKISSVKIDLKNYGFIQKKKSLNNTQKQNYRFGDSSVLDKNITCSFYQPFLQFF